MRDLYEEILEHYELNEGLSKEPSSPIESDEHNAYHRTKLTTYNSDSEFTHPSRYHKNYSGVTHLVSWKNNKRKEEMDNRERKNSLHDAMHLHNHFVKNATEVGDVVKNTPLEDEDQKGGNKRSRIYAKSAGFGNMSNSGLQYGIVKQHPDDHPDEHKRGQKFLHPLEHEEIAAHGDAPSAGASDNKVRHITKKFENQSWHQTKMNSAIHNLVNSEDKPGEHEVEYDISKNKKVEALKDLALAHQASVTKYTKPGDKVSKRISSSDSIRSISTNHHLGMGAPKEYDMYNRKRQSGIVGKDGKMVPHND